MSPVTREGRMKWGHPIPRQEDCVPLHPLLKSYPQSRKSDIDSEKGAEKNDQGNISIHVKESNIQF